MRLRWGKRIAIVTEVSLRQSGAIALAATHASVKLNDYHVLNSTHT